MKPKINTTIGVLALQGDFAEHIDILKKIGVKAVEVKTKEDLEKISGLIIPGGESTTISKLMKKYGIDEEIKKLAKKGVPIYGTCAGSILLAKRISGKIIPNSLSLIDIDIERNSYGSQLDSFEENIEVFSDEKKKKIHAIFIRAPIIRKIGKNVQILAKNQKKELVLAEEGNILISTFHPELTGDETVHRYFIGKIGG